MRSAPDQAAPGSDAPARNGRTRRVARGEHAVGTAVLFATAPAGDGTPAAALAWEGSTLIGRLLDQLAALGIRRAHVITRPEWVAALESDVREHPVALELHPSAGVAGDLRAVEVIARAEAGAIVLANADIVTQGEALAGLLADPRVTTGILATTVRKVQRQMAFRMRGRRGRVFSAASPYHYVHQPNGTFLGVLKIAPLHRAELADVAARLARGAGRKGRPVEAGAVPPLAGGRRGARGRRGTWRDGRGGDRARAHGRRAQAR